MTTPPRILHLEDDPSDAQLVVGLLEQEGLEVELRWVDGRAQFESALAEPWDLILADFALPGVTHLEALELAQARQPGTPFIYLSGTFGEEMAVAALQQGATDYLLKERLDRLGSAVSRALEISKNRVEAAALEQALRDSEERYKQLVETAPDAIFIEYDGRFDYLNPAAVELFGIHGTEDLMGHPVLENVHPDDLARVRDRVQQFQDDPAPLHRTEIRLNRPDGKLVDVEVTTSPIPWKGGIAARVFLRDITALKAAWQAVTDSEENYRQLVENTPDCIFVSSDGQFRYVNPAGLRMFEVDSKAEILGESMLGFVYPEDLPLMAARVQRFHSAGEPSPPQELRVVGRRGRITPVEVTTTRVQFQGELAARVFMRDLSAQKAAESALKVSEARWHFALEGAGDGVWDWDVPTGTVFFSPRWKRILGFGDHEIGNGFEEWSGRVHPEDLLDVLADLQPHLDGQTPAYVNEHRMRCKDGGYKWILVRGLVVSRDAAGKPLRVVGTHADITGRKQAELHEATRGRTMTLLAGGAPLNEILDALVRGVEAEHPGTLGSVLLLDPDGTRFLTGAAPSLPDFFNQAIHRETIGPAAGSCGTAAFTGERVVVADIQTDALWAEYKELAAQAGLAACWSEPIRGPKGRVLGTFTMYHRQSHVPDEAELTAIGEGAQLAAVAIERKAAQEALQESEALLSQAQVLAHMGHWTLDLPTGKGTMSPNLIRLYGLTEEPTLEAFMAMVVPEDRVRLATGQEVMATGKLDEDEFEFRLRRSDGEIRHFHAAIKLDRNAQGVPLRLMGSNLDITENVKHQEALRLSESRLEEAQRVAHLGSWSWDLATGAMIWSDEMCRIFGVEPGVHVPTMEDSINRVHPEDRPKAQTLISEGLAQLKPFCYEFRILRPDGEIRTILNQGEVLVDGHGRAAGLAGACFDITGLKRAEQELRYQNELYQMVQRATNDLIWDWDLATNSLAWSAAIQAMFGYPLDEVPPTLQWWQDNLHPDDRDRVLKGIHEIIDEGGSAWSDKYRFRRKNGEYIQVLDRGYVVRDALGKATRMIGAMSDLSLHLRAEKALAANQAKSEFLATMSHEIRTPMIGMLGMVEILSHSQLDAEQRSALGVIQSSARALLGIIGSILDFSKIEAGKLELELQVVSLRRMVEEEFASCSGAAASKGLRMACDIDPRIAEAHRVDPVRFRQILDNFLSNALKFTQQGTVGIRVEVLDSGAESQTLAFRVWDTGIGVSPENQKRLFQPFVQAESTTTRRFGGTGLGLSICLRLAQMMGGSITMESEVGKGTTMSFVAPFPVAGPASLTGPAQPAAWEPRKAPTREAALAAGCLVLLVEDHPTNRQVLLQQLLLAGYQADAAEDGVLALEAWRQHRYGLVLTDIHMPRMDGYQLAMELRKAEALEGRAHVPVLALTANALHGELDRCLAAGMDDCIIKPVSIPDLDAKLRHWLPAASKSATRRPVDAGANPSNPSRASAEVLPVDLAFLAGYSLGNRAGTLEILRDFRDTTRADMSALRDAVVHGKQKEVAREAHRIKGASAMVGALPLAGAAEFLEEQARSDDHGRAAALASVEAAFARLDRFVTEEIERG